MGKIDGKIGFRIRERRESLRYSREVFAEKSGISADFLYDIETGRKDFTTDTLKKICNAFNINSDCLLYGTGSQAEQIEFLLSRLDGKQLKLLAGFLIVMVDSDNSS